MRVLLPWLSTTALFATVFVAAGVSCADKEAPRRRVQYRPGQPIKMEPGERNENQIHPAAQPAASENADDQTTEVENAEPDPAPIDVDQVVDTVRTKIKAMSVQFIPREPKPPAETTPAAAEENPDAPLIDMLEPEYCCIDCIRGRRCGYPGKCIFDEWEPWGIDFLRVQTVDGPDTQPRDYTREGTTKGLGLSLKRTAMMNGIKGHWLPHLNQWLPAQLIGSLDPNGLSADAQLVIEQGRRWQVGSIMTGQPNAVLQAAAERAAAYMASIRVQGHHGWESRFQQLSAQFPGYEVGEICAESWPGRSRERSAWEMFDAWRQWPGHWSKANWTNCYYGYAMARGSNGIWYGCGILARLNGAGSAATSTPPPATTTRSNRPVIIYRRWNCQGGSCRSCR